MDHEVERYVALLAHGGADVLVVVALQLIVHLIEDAAGTVLVLLAHQREGAGLGEGVLGLVDLAVDGEDVGLDVILHEADTTHGEHIVDVAYVVGHLVVLILQLLHVLAELMVRAGHLADIAT